MNEKLYIHNDAPEPLKQVIDVSQRMLDNMKAYKAKADSKTLTREDLRELTRCSNALSKEYPRSAEPQKGYPPRTSDMDELENYSRARIDESTRQVEAEGGPVFKVNSLDELKNLATLSPAILGQKVLNAAEEKRAAEEKEREAGGTPDETYEGQSVSAKQTFSVESMEETFERFCSHYYHAKGVYSDLPYDWTETQPYEAPLYNGSSVFRGYGVKGDGWLKAVLTGETENEAFGDKQPEAALALASRNKTDACDIDSLLDLWQEDEELGEPIVRALKVSDNDLVDRRLNERFDPSPPDIKAGIVEILDYRKTLSTEACNNYLQREPPKVCDKIVRAFLTRGIPVETAAFQPLLNDPETDYYEEALLSAFLNGESAYFLQARVLNDSTPENVNRLPLYLACAGNRTDFAILEKSLDHEGCFEAAVMGLGIMGLTEGVPLLIGRFSTTIADKKEWEEQVLIHDSLNLITGARLELPFPEIAPGPEGKECEVKIAVAFKSLWSRWWLDQRRMFSPHTRYRRGVCWNLKRCIDEMAYERGHYWSRQYAYYELVIRSGASVAPFFADWDVNDQLDAIERWRVWWRETGCTFPDDPWLFHGKPPGRLF